MTDKLFVKPAVEGSIVRQPEREMRPLPAEGDWVPDNMYWRTRIAHEDVVETPPPEQGANEEAAAERHNTRRRVATA